MYNWGHSRRCRDRASSTALQTQSLCVAISTLPIYTRCAATGTLALYRLITDGSLKLRRGVICGGIKIYGLNSMECSSLMICLVYSDYLLLHIPYFTPSPVFFSPGCVLGVDLCWA